MDRKCDGPHRYFTIDSYLLLFSVRKEIKVRPGFTPQEDVRRFRGTKQAQMDATALPKGHIIGWVAPSASEPAKPKSKSAKKNAKRKEKRDEKRTDVASEEPVRENWEDEDEDDSASKAPDAGTDVTPAPADTAKTPISPPPNKPNGTTVVSSGAIQKLAADLEQLNTK
jgi:partner of Y14 and mago protein